MRLGVNFIFEKDFIPSNYRRYFLSLIKEALKISDKSIFENLYSNKSKNVMKPFTFSVSFIPDDKNSNEGIIHLKSNKVNFYFSSFYPEFIILIYNGFLNLSHRGWLNLFENKIKINNFYYIKSKPITKEKITFKTLSPIVVRNIRDKKGKGFIDCDHKDFKNNLFFNVRSMARKFLNYELKDDEFEIIDMKMTSKKVTLYGQEIASKGILTIHAPKNILQLIYDAGIGAKRSQGFGMLEVVK